MASRGPCRCDRESLIRQARLLEAVSQMSLRIWSQPIQSPCLALQEAKAQPAFGEFSVHVPALLICELAEGFIIMDVPVYSISKPSGNDEHLADVLS
jgi:hypothetical protein